MDRATVNLIIVAVLAVLTVIVLIAARIYINRSEAEERGYLEYLGTLFKTGRFLLVYRCKSRTFDQWEPIYYLKILDYKDGLAWCERYTPDGLRIDKGEEVNVKDTIELFHRCILTDGEPDGKHSCTVVKRWESKVQ